MTKNCLTKIGAIALTFVFIATNLLSNKQPVIALSKEQPDSISTIGAAPEGFHKHTDVPEPPKKKRNPHLDTQLDDLVEAAKHGQAAAFAKNNMIDLNGKNIVVIIYSAPDQFEAAIKVIERYGSVTSTQKETRWIAANVPVNKLLTLANNKSINFIEVPTEPWLGD